MRDDRQGTVTLRWLLCSLACTLCACSDDDGVTATSGTTEPPQPGAQLACAPGEFYLPDGSCQPPGVPEDGCGDGFVHDGTEGCVAILPDEPCRPAMMALPGETACRDVAPCASGTWGAIPVDGATVYVDITFVGGEGSATNPFATIQQAIDAAPSGGLVAIAAGSYEESIVVNKPVRIYGVCPALVAIVGTGPAIDIDAAGAVELHDLALSGAAEGASISGGELVLERVWIHDTEDRGVWAYGGSSVTLRGTLIESARSHGLAIWGANATIDDTVIRNTRLTASTNVLGRAIEATDRTPASPIPALLVRRSWLSGNREVAIGSYGAETTVEDTLIEGTAPTEAGEFGAGIEAAANIGTGRRGFIHVYGSVIERNRFCGVCGYDTEADIAFTTVRDVEPELASDDFGYGIKVEHGNPIFAAPRPPSSVTSTSIARTYTIGLNAIAADLTVESILVRQTRSSALDGKFGRGINAEPNLAVAAASSLTLRGGLVEESQEVGVLVLGSVGEIDSVLVRDVRPRTLDDAYGAGIVFHYEPITAGRASGSLSRAVVEDAFTVGIASVGSDLVASDVIVRRTRAQATASDFGDGIVASAWIPIAPGDLVDTTLEVTRATVEANERAGIGSFAASVGVGSSLIDCNVIALDAETVEGRPASFVDRDGNVCGCGGEVVTCKVLSSNLVPPPALPF